MKNLQTAHTRSDTLRMMPPGNTRSAAVGRLGLVSVLAAVGVMLGSVLSGTAVRAQDNPGPGGVSGSIPGVNPGAGDGGGADEAIDAPLLDASHALRAHRQVQDWLAAGEASVQGLQPIRVTGLFGVRLTLRSEGFMVGQGEAYRQDIPAALNAPGPAVDLLPLLAEATVQAIAGVRDSLADARLRAVLEGRYLPESRELSVAEVSSRMVIDLELGYGLRSLAVPAYAGPDAVYARFAPCYHGLGFSDTQSGAWAWVWPGEATARNISPSSQLAVGIKRLGFDRGQITQLARPGGIGLARFRTFHVVRPSPGARPMLLVRGASDRPRYAVSERGLETLGDLLIEHLSARITTDLDVRGTYLPTSGRYDPPIATDDQAALACYAMTHHSRYLTTARPNDTNAAAFARRALQVATGIGWRTIEDGGQPGEQAGGQAGGPSGGRAGPQVAALVLLTLLETRAPDPDKDLRDRLGERLLSLVQPSGPDDAAGGGPQMNDASLALSALALATWYERTRDPRVGEAVWSLMDRLWDRPDHTAPNLSALPWLALAHERAADLLAQTDPSGERQAELARRRTVLAEVVERLCLSQVIERPALGPDDVLGGFVLTPGPAGSPPNPNWRNAQPMMFLSTVLRDGSVTQGRDKLGWLLSAGYSARFVGQLMMDDASCYYVRDRKAARGGVRMAPWDNRLALAPTAMSLLAVTELQTTLATFKPAPAAPKPDTDKAGDEVNALVEHPPAQAPDPAKQTAPTPP
jgi:hypothetical protein